MSSFEMEKKLSTEIADRILEHFFYEKNEDMKRFGKLIAECAVFEALVNGYGELQQMKLECTNV